MSDISGPPTAAELKMEGRALERDSEDREEMSPADTIAHAVFLVGAAITHELRLARHELERLRGAVNRR